MRPRSRRPDGVDVDGNALPFEDDAALAEFLRSAEVVGKREDRRGDYRAAPPDTRR